jgi:hypothetical protein
MCGLEWRPAFGACLTPLGRFLMRRRGAFARTMACGTLRAKTHDAITIPPRKLHGRFQCASLLWQCWQ